MNQEELLAALRGALASGDAVMLKPLLAARHPADITGLLAEVDLTKCARYWRCWSRLVGTVSLKDFIVAPPHARVEALMRRDPIFVQVDADREIAARLVSKYDLIALPVVDPDRRRACRMHSDARAPVDWRRRKATRRRGSAIVR